MNRARFPLEFCPEFCELPPVSAQLRAGVIVPARDEAAHITGALDALAAQRDLNGEPLDPETFEILLLANNCRDNTADLARRWGRAHRHICLHVVETRYLGARACIGYARRMAMNAACFRLLQNAPQTEVSGAHAPRAICSTDADTRVSVFWVAHILEEMRLGADAVGGRVLLAHEKEEFATRKTYLLDTAYRLLGARVEAKIDPQSADPWPRHFQFFGASLAIAPQTYAHIGGLPRARCLEDVALETELLRRDLSVRHSPNVLALTSARRSGRVQTGLSTQLDEWAQLDELWLVPSGHEIAWRARLKRQLRAHFYARPQPCEGLGEVARELLLPPALIRERLGAAEFFGELWQEIWELAWSDPDLRCQWAPVAVEVALEQLRAMLRGIVPK